MLADGALADKDLADAVDAVIGVDTHTDSHSACVVDARGAQLASVTVETTAQGYGRLLAFVADHAPGPRLVWAVEGTRSHGVGLTRFLHQAGQHVIEAGRPKRAQRRPGGKSDARDALHAARNALARTDHAVPRADGSREALRLLLLTRSTASGARTVAVNALKSVILTAPDALRDKLRGLTTLAQVQTCSRLRIHSSMNIEDRTRRHALKQLARRITALDSELADNKQQLTDLVTTLMPVLLTQPGIGPISAAQLLVSWSHPGRCRNEAAFASLAGTAPLEASSGRVTRHRLSRFDDRQLNRALHTITIARARYDTRTQDYINRRRTEGKNDAEYAAASNGTSPVAFSASSNAPPNRHLDNHRSVKPGHDDPL